MTKFERMTVNETLFVQGLLADWDAAVAARNASRLREILTSIELISQADEIVTAKIYTLFVPK
jgi:Ni,Fe-hydrogenase III large subunit